MRGQPLPRSDVLRVGFVINPIAGIGGEVGLKGSDGEIVQRQARELGGRPRGLDRAVRFLKACVEAPLPSKAARLEWLSWGGAMGEDAFIALQQQGVGLPFAVVGTSPAATSAADTRRAALELQRRGADLLVFVGGDGTARDLLDALGEGALVLGVPAGVKMHSGVFATTPEAAAAVVRDLASGAIVTAQNAEVRDLDEARRRAGELQSRRYGELQIPQAGGYLQHTKEGGRENESLALEEIVAHVRDRAEGQIVLGPGSSCLRIKQALGMEGTLLGVDVWHDGVQTGTDVNADWLMDHAPQPARVIVSFIRRQGFLFGRGNQQLTAAWLSKLPQGTLTIVCTRSKLATLDGRPLLVDTDDRALNDALCGLHRLLVGYEDELWYRIAQHS